MRLLAEDAVAVFGCASTGERVKRLAGKVDARSGRNADVRIEKGARNVASGNRGNIFLRVYKTHLPERLGGKCIGVEGVGAVFLGSDEEDVGQAVVGAFEPRDGPRPGGRIAVHGKESDA